MDEPAWARIDGTSAATAVDVVLGADGSVVRSTAGALVPGEALPEGRTVLDVRPLAAPDDPDDRLADLVAALLTADEVADPALRTGVVLTDDPVEVRRILTVVAALRVEHDGVAP